MHSNILFCSVISLILYNKKKKNEKLNINSLCVKMNEIRSHLTVFFLILEKIYVKEYELRNINYYVNITRKKAQRQILHPDLISCNTHGTHIFLGKLRGEKKWADALPNHCPLGVLKSIRFKKSVHNLGLFDPKYGYPIRLLGFRMSYRQMPDGIWNDMRLDLYSGYMVFIGLDMEIMEWIFAGLYSA